MQPVEVRRALPADLPALLRLEALFPSDAMSRRSLRRFIDNSGAVFLVAIDGADGPIVGNLLLLTRRDRDSARLYSIVVDPAARGRGIAQQLIEAAHRQARQRGCRRVVLEVRCDNAAALALYRRLGYQPVEMLPTYYEDGADGTRLAVDLT